MQPLSREQLAVSEFLAATLPLRELVADDNIPTLRHFAEGFVQAVAAFGVSDMHARQAERLSILNIQAERARLSAEISSRDNDRGIRILSYVRDDLARFRSGIPRLSDARPSVRAFDELRMELKHQLAELELKPGDITKIDGLAEDCFRIARAEGPGGLAGYLDAQLRRIEEVRRQADRGRAENIPIWKAIAVAAFFGIALWALFKCVFGFFGGCTLAEGAALAVAGGIAAAITRFC